LKFLIWFLFFLPISLMAADDSAVCLEDAKRLCQLPPTQEVNSRIGCLLKNRPTLTKPCVAYVNGKYRTHIDSTNKTLDGLKISCSKEYADCRNPNEFEQRKCVIQKYKKGQISPVCRAAILAAFPGPPRKK
jgi:hypothetical protein